MDKKEIEILTTCFKNKEKYENVAKKLNDYRMKKAKQKKYIHISPAGIPYRYAMLKLISDDEAKIENDIFKKKQGKKVSKERANAGNKNWNKQKKLAMERSESKCNICNSNEKLEVHHIISFKESKSHELDNLIVLCQDCHKIVGKNKLWISAYWVDYDAKEIFKSIVMKYLLIISKMDYDVTYGLDSSTHSGPFFTWEIIKKENTNTPSVEGSSK